MTSRIPGRDTLPKALGCALFASFLFAGCSSLKVPIAVPSFPPGHVFLAESDGIRIEAHPLEGHEAYWELFDEDLPRAGIAAVRVRISSAHGESLDLKGLRWKLRAAQASVSPLSAREVLRQYYRGRGIRTYSVRAHERSRQDLRSLMLKPPILAPGGSVEGFLFFKVDPGRTRNWTSG